MLYHHGFLYWVVAFYVNGIMLTATWLLLRFVAQARHLYKYQSIGVTLASLFPWAGFVLYLSGKNPFPGLEITAVSFGFTGAILAFILNRLSFLDIVPVARDSLVEKMQDGMVVLDGQNRVVDINPVALTIFEIPPQSRWLGKPAATLLKKFPTVWLALQNPAEAPTECETASPQPRAFDVSIASLHHRSGQLAGKAIILHEITRLKKTEKELQEAKRQLEEKLTQIERLKDNLRDESIHDALTGLFNRRYVEEILENEVTRARRGGYPLAFVVLDIDHFKQINDAYGHSQGDELLRALGTAFRGHFRMGDIPCRYGGDEFLLLMPHSSASDALIRIESFRRVCRDLLQKHQADAPPITFSAGIAAYPAHAAAAQDLFGVADQALYQAKERGRNQTCLPTSP
jgi:diguanylate cyclase (GGDEF)-like protein